MSTQRVPPSISEALRDRQRLGALRSTVVAQPGVDLCSNDYLGISRQLAVPAVVEAVINRAPPSGTLGATGSRLVSGTADAHLAFEDYLASFHRAESALLFGSGYEANVGLLSAIGKRGDTIVYDELVHASMRDGVRLGVSRSYSFRHNDVDDLRRRISLASGECFVAVESVYSMDGHVAPLAEIAAVCREQGAYLIVDEAHSTGVYGPRGEGLVVQDGLEAEVFARVHTFGKAIGYRGACVVGSAELKSFLINFARPFIYSTAPDALAVAFMREAYRLTAESCEARSQLHALLLKLPELKEKFSELVFADSSTSIQAVFIQGNSAVVAAEGALQAAGFFTKAIRSPTVPAGTERLRLSLHSFNSISELSQACVVLRDFVRGQAVV